MSVLAGKKQAFPYSGKGRSSSFSPFPPTSIGFVAEKREGGGERGEVDSTDRIEGFLFQKGESKASPAGPHAIQHGKCMRLIVVVAQTQ